MLKKFKVRSKTGKSILNTTSLVAKQTKNTGTKRLEKKEKKEQLTGLQNIVRVPPIQHGGGPARKTKDEHGAK